MVAHLHIVKTFLKDQTELPLLNQTQSDAQGFGRGVPNASTQGFGRAVPNAST